VFLRHSVDLLEYRQMTAEAFLLPSKLRLLLRCYALTESGWMTDGCVAAGFTDGARLPGQAQSSSINRHLWFQVSDKQNFEIAMIGIFPTC